MPQALALRTRRLEALWEALAKTPYFAETARELPATLEGLARMPLTDKDAYREASPPLSERTLSGPMADATVFRSGGTSGEPKFAVYGERDIAAFVPLFARCYEAAGLRSTDRIGNAFAAGSLYASFVLVNRFLSGYGALNFPLTTAMAPDQVASHAKAFGINALLGFPSWLMQLAEAFAAAGVPLEKVFYAGEPLVPEEARYLREALGVQVIGSAGYGAVDSGLMALQCVPMTGTSVHHVLDEVVLELIDPATGAPIAEPGVPGLVVVTHLERHLHPVVRYPVGDLAAWEAGPCPCGDPAPRFALLGRGDDVLRVGYASVTYGEVAPAIAAVPGLTGAIQMIKQREARRDRLVFAVELARGAGAMGDLAERATEAVFAAKPDLRKLVESGYVWPLEFRLVPSGALPRQPVTGKLKRTHDESR